MATVDLGGDLGKDIFRVWKLKPEEDIWKTREERSSLDNWF